MTQTETAVSAGLSRPLGPEMIDRYRRDGYLLLAPDFLPGDVLDVVGSVMPDILARDSPARILERDGQTVRTVYGLHQSEPAIAALTRMPALLGAVCQLIGDDVYVHQSKVNIKAPFAGDQWEWHQDYVYWLRGDGIQRPDLVNVAVFLDEVTEFNGPLTFVPGSHTGGVLSGATVEGMPVGYQDAPAWVATLTATEQVQIAPSIIERLAREKGLASPKGPAGSILMFHPNILHSSAANISPFRRAMLLFVYNSVNNAGVAVARPRPPFLAEPDVTALRPL